MKKSYIIGAMSLILSSGMAWADTSSMPSKDEIESALKECSSSANGDQEAMDSCMSAKGYTKPSGPPPGDQNGGTPPSPPSQ